MTKCKLVCIKYTKIQTNVKNKHQTFSKIFSNLCFYRKHLLKFCYQLSTNTRFPWDHKSILRAKWWSLHSCGSNDIHNEGRLSRHYRNQIQQISVPCQLTPWPGWTHCKGWRTDSWPLRCGRPQCDWPWSCCLTLCPICQGQTHS